MAAETTGTCLCGACAYSYTDEPAVKAICYCSLCRKLSGGTNTVNFTIPEDKFTLTKGTPKSYTAEHPYGMTITVYFCTECGNNLWKEASAPQFKGLKLVQAGTVSDAAKLNDSKIDVELYAPERVSWLAPLQEVAQKTEF